MFKVKLLPILLLCLCKIAAPENEVVAEKKCVIIAGPTGFMIPPLEFRPGELPEELIIRAQEHMFIDIYNACREYRNSKPPKPEIPSIISREHTLPFLDLPEGFIQIWPRFKWANQECKFFKLSIDNLKEFVDALKDLKIELKRKDSDRETPSLYEANVKFLGQIQVYEFCHLVLHQLLQIGGETEGAPAIDLLGRLREGQINIRRRQNHMGQWEIIMNEWENPATQVNITYFARGGRKVRLTDPHKEIEYNNIDDKPKNTIELLRYFLKTTGCS